jgi:hypothetical protein
MVKNLPTIERSTKIRFGKNTLDDQAENTIVFNASNTAIQANTPGAVYLHPVRNRPNYDDPQIVLLMYNKQTKEITESGEAATDIIETNLEGATLRGNVIEASTVYFNNTSHISFVTSSNVGIINTNPQHTLSIGSNVYVDDVGANVLVVSGGVSINGNLVVNGGVTTITSENLSIGDAIIELGKNNTSDDTTLDLGLIMTRPTSNVTIGFREGSGELVMGYTESSADSNTITPLTSESLDVHVYGRVLTEANVGILNTSPIHTLDVGSNLYVDEFGSNILVVSGNTNITGDLTVDTDTLFVDASTNSVGIETTDPKANLHVVGNVYVSSNLTVDEDTLHVDATTNSVGIETKNPKANLHVVGNVYVSSNLTVDEDTLHVDVVNKSIGLGTVNPKANLHVVGNVYMSSNLTVDENTLHVDATTNSVGIETKNPKANLHVVGNVYVSSNLTVDEDTLHVDAMTNSVGIETKNPKANLHVVGNVYISSNLTVDTDTLHVDVVNKSIGLGTVNPTSNLHVVGNVYVTSNTTTDGTLTLNHPTTALVTDLNSNVEVKLNQLANVNINTTDVYESLRTDHVLVYDGANWVNEYPIHNYIRIYNNSGSTIYAGNCVYIVGYHNQNLVEVGLASATSADTMPSIGIVYNDSILQGDEGVAVAYGKVNSIDTSAFLEGDTLYVSNVGTGLLSNVKPYDVDLDLIQNIGVCTRSHNTSGAIFVTGIGRSNDIPNARIVLDETDINFVYVNDQNNDLKKIEPSNLLTQLQTLEQVTNTGNTTSNTIQFTNTTTGIVTTGNVEIGGNISVADLSDGTNKYLPMVKTDGFFEKSPVFVTPEGKYVISASEAEFLGNITLGGNTTIIASTSVTIEDRIFGVGANNSTTGLDSGFMIEHAHLEEGGIVDYANIAIIHHAVDHRLALGYTQNTFTDDQILYYQYPERNLLIDLQGNVAVQNNATVGETLDVTGVTTIGGDLTVGGASNLFVDVSTSRVGINEDSPQKSLDVNGDARVQSTTDTATKTVGALIVSGGLGVASNIHSTNVYAESHVGVGTVATTRPVHVMANSAGGIYVNGDGNDARVSLEATGTTADPVASFIVNGGQAFSMGVDNSENDTFNIANHATDVGLNARMTMTPAGITTITNTTNATSKTTGALKVAGGLGVAGDVYATNVVASSNLTVGTNILHVDTVSPTSNVGIGTTNPQYSLDVVGDINFSNAFFQGGSLFVSTPWTIEENPDALSYVDGNVGIGGANPGANLHVTGNTYISSNLEVGTGNLFVDTTTSNVGIGSTTPEYSLDVVGDINFSGGLYQGKSLFVSTPWTIEESPDALSYTAGNVGIGVINPSANLHVVGNVHIESNLEVGNIIFDTVTVNAIQGLEGIVNTSNITSNTIQFTNTDTAITTVGNVYVGGLITQSSAPAFTVKRSSTTSVIGPSNIEYNTVVIDNTSNYTSSNGRFTAPVTGHYFFSAHGVWQGAETIYDFTINGTRQNINALCDSTSSSNDLQISISAVLYLTAGQYVNVYQVSGGTYGTDNNSFCGYLIN